MFNDVFTLDSGAPALVETGIAWPSDVKSKFVNPSSLDNKTTVYLSDIYPGIIPAIDPADPQKAGTGVKNEHFIVWMRTAALPTFRKLYGKIETNLDAGVVLQFTITNNFDSAAYGGSKTLILSTTSWLGGKNPFLGLAYIVVGVLCLCLAAAFKLKQTISPRDLGDTKYLVWKSKQ